MSRDWTSSGLTVVGVVNLNLFDLECVCVGGFDGLR